MRKILTIALLGLLTFPLQAMSQTPTPADVLEVAEVVASPTPAATQSEGVPQMADPSPAVASDAVAVPAVTIPETPEQVGQQVVAAADNFKTGSWIAGILALISVALYFVNRYAKKNKTDKNPPPKA